MMAEDLGLFHYVRDTFVKELAHDFDADDGENPYCLDSNPFRDSTNTLQSSAGRTDADSFAPGSPSAGSPSRTAQVAIENYLPSGLFPSDGGGQVSFQSSSLQPLACSHSNPEISEQAEGSFLAGYELSQGPSIQLEMNDFQHSSIGQEPLQYNTLDEQILRVDPHSVESRSVGIPTSTSGHSSFNEGRSIWRGATPALLMQQLEGPRAQAEPYLQPSFHQSQFRSMIASSKPRPFNLTRTSTQYSRGADTNNCGTARYRGTVGVRMDLKSILPNSKPATNISETYNFLQDDLGTKPNTSLTLKDMLLARAQGQRSNSFKSELNFEKVAAGNITTSNSALIGASQGRNFIPGSALSGEICSTNGSVHSGNNPWLGRTISSGPSAIDHDADQVGSIWVDFLKADSRVQNNPASLAAIDGQLELERVRKKARGDLSSGDQCMAPDITNTLVEQKQLRKLQENFLALLQPDCSSKEYKALLLDDTIEFLKDLRRRLHVNDAASVFPDATRGSLAADRNNEAPPATSSRSGRKLGVDGLPIFLHLEDLELETEGVDISPHLTLEPQIEVRMMENQHVMVKLTAKDRPGLFTDIVLVLRDLGLDVQHANIRTSKNGQRHDIFAAKMQLPIFDSHTTHAIALALNNAMNTKSSSTTPSASAEPHTP